MTSSPVQWAMGAPSDSERYATWLPDEDETELMKDLAYTTSMPTLDHDADYELRHIPRRP